jgi:hypothetical protein
MLGNIVVYLFLALILGVAAAWIRNAIKSRGEADQPRPDGRRLPSAAEPDRQLPPG